MNIVGMEPSAEEPTHVHTIDIWFSRRQASWVVERLNADGHVIGMSVACPTEEDATACVAEWLRAHGETYLASRPASSERRNAKLASRPRRKAA